LTDDEDNSAEMEDNEAESSAVTQTVAPTIIRRFQIEVPLLSNHIVRMVTTRTKLSQAA